MPLIPLLLCGIDEARWPDIACRLRDAALHVTFGPSYPAKAEIQRALQDGSRVLIASEPCWPWRDVEDIMQQARQANMQCMIANPDHYLPSRQLIKQQIPGKLGAAGLIRIHRWEPA